ncbi:MAG: SMC-Scp complex subunit ScpB [Acidobacteriota bacterium]
MSDPFVPPDPGAMRAVVEALVFAAEEPLTVSELSELFPDRSRDELEAVLAEVSAACEAGDRGLQVVRVAGGYSMTTKPAHGSWVRALFRSRNRRRLSSAALETLAIVAYRQPITTPEIQALRGTDPSGVLQTLLDRKLVRVMGRKRVVGKPILYGTTREFLAHFGLNSLEDLPCMEDFGHVVAARQPAGETAPSTGLFRCDDGSRAGETNGEGRDEGERPPGGA